MARNNLKQQLAQNVARRQSRLQDAEPAIPQHTLDPAARTVPLAQVRANPLNARRIDLSDPEQSAALEVLALSIQTHGVLQAPLVRELPAGGYEIIAGDRRFLAAQKAGLETIPVRVRQAEDAVLRQINMVENLVRAELSPADMGRGFAELKRALQLDRERQRSNFERPRSNLEPQHPDHARTDTTSGIAEQANATQGSHSLTWQDVALITGLTPRSMQRYIAIANLIDELDALDLSEAEKTGVSNLTERQLRPVLSLEAGPQRAEFVRRIARENLSSRQSEQIAKSLRAAATSSYSKVPSKSSSPKSHSPSTASTAPDSVPTAAEKENQDPGSMHFSEGEKSGQTVWQVEQTLEVALQQIEQVIECLSAYPCTASHYHTKVEPHLHSLHEAIQRLEALNPDKKSEINSA